MAADGVDRERPLLALLDGHSLAYRAFFALPEDLRTTTGQVTNAVYGFTSMLVKLLSEHRPDRIGVMFDKGRPAQRLAILPDYKGHREDAPDTFRSQIPLIFEVLDALAIPRVLRDGTEADDLIASYATQATAAGIDTLVVTGDRDVFQLVDDHVKVLYTTRGITETKLMDMAAVEERYGVAPDRYAMLAALRGDPSDNIAGVPGVGDKTAAKLLATYGDLDGIFAHLDEISGKKLPTTLAEHEQQVRDGYRVALLDCDLDLPLSVDELRMGEVDRDAVARVFDTLEFRALTERLEDALGVHVGDEPAVGLGAEPVALGPGELVEWVAGLPAGAPVAVVARTESRPPRTRWTTVALACEGRDPAAAMLDRLADADIVALRDLLADPARPLLTHGSKELLHAAAARDMSVVGLRTDTELGAYVLQPGSRSYGLEALARNYLGIDIDVGKGDADGQLSMGLDDTLDDVARRAHAVVQLAEVIDSQLEERRQTDLLCGLELPLVPVLARMEDAGIAVDLHVLAEIGEELGDRIRDLREEIYGYAGVEFNLDSPKQLQTVLFDDLGLQKTKKIKTGYSTDAQALRGLIDEHPVIEPLLEYREVSKLKGTYVDALPPLVDDATGRIHPEFQQAVAVTGRLSSQHPNIQNIPIRTETGRAIRQAFVPGEGFDRLVVADYSQIELRVMAHLSQDEGLLAAFSSGEDIHATTAAMVWDLPIDAVDNTLRSRIKGMTYGLAYGLSAFGLSQQLGIPPDEARELMDAYFARFPKVGAYLDGVVEQARRDGYTSTLLGRRRYLPDLVSSNRQRREMAERMALNAPIQGTAADIIKKAMIAVDSEMRRRGLASQLLVQVHDELICEVPDSEVDELTGLLVSGMGGVVGLDVALEVDTASGASWFDAEKH